MMLDKYKKFSIEFLIPFGIGLVVPLLMIRNGWIEPDSFAFYNYYCLNGSSFDIPFLANIVFYGVNCSATYFWYGLQAFIWVMFFIALVDSYKIYHDIESWKVGIIGFSLSFIYGVLAIEDDFLALPLIAYAIWAIYLGNKKDIILGVLALVLAFFFWKGTILIGSIIILSKINWKLGLLPVIAYIINNGLDQWGGSTEAIIGLGVVTLIPFLILLYYSSKQKIRSFRSSKTFLLSIPFILLTIFQAKWGLYTILFLPAWLDELIEDEVFQRKLVRMAGIVFVISIIGIGLTKSPTKEQWVIIDKAVAIQKNGNIVVNEWSVGRFFEYKGGKASQAGGIKGEQETKNKYWLGQKISNCEILDYSQDLFLQKC